MKMTRISKKIPKTSSRLTYHNELLGHANKQKQKIAQIEFDVRRCLLACEFRTRSLLNNNCVNIRSRVARDYLVLQVCLLLVQLPCDRVLTMPLILYTAAMTEM